MNQPPSTAGRGCRRGTARRRTPGRPSAKRPARWRSAVSARPRRAHRSIRRVVRSRPIAAARARAGAITMGTSTPRRLRRVILGRRAAGYDPGVIPGYEARGDAEADGVVCRSEIFGGGHGPHRAGHRRQPGHRPGHRAGLRQAGRPGGRHPPRHAARPDGPLRRPVRHHRRRRRSTRRSPRSRPSWARSRCSSPTPASPTTRCCCGCPRSSSPASSTPTSPARSAAPSGRPRRCCAPAGAG